jgi:hypothetical protein
MGPLALGGAPHELDRACRPGHFGARIGGPVGRPVGTRIGNKNEN